MSRKRALKYLYVNSHRTYSTSARLSQESRPSTAPRQYPNISHIRRNVKLHEDNLILRKYDQHRGIPAKIVQNAQKSGELNHTTQQPRSRLKELEEGLKSKEGDKNDILQKIRAIKPDLEKLIAQKDAIDAENQNLALELPNLTSSNTPTNGEPKLISYINYEPERQPSYGESANHSLIGEKLGLIDFSSAAMTSGWGFYFLLNEAALLEQALILHALSMTTEQGWKVISPPSLVYSHMADSCGFQPRDQNDEQQIWQIAQSAKDLGKPKRSLAATAEIPLAGFYARTDIQEQSLPIKVVGSSRCYRAEAGARGVGTKGLYRVHEFTKVEMFAWTNCPNDQETLDEAEWTSQSTKMFDEMVQIQKDILSSLNLPCRVLEMPSSDLGASAYRKIDIEALFPSRIAHDGGWGEVTSVSICTDYQSRRLDTRILDKSGSRKRFPHTVNGTAIAIPRVLAAILENGWNEKEGCVVIPEVLRKYMGGLEKIGPR